nr:MAG TPA: hypothetical protein [Caudoviricetes sp.]DAQ65555.1 MAG TPA: hypothetical protein [Caudoviricetes sp.]
MKKPGLFRPGSSWCARRESNPPTKAQSNCGTMVFGFCGIIVLHLV